MAKRFLSISILTLAITLLLSGLATAGTTYAPLNAFAGWDFATVGNSFNNGIGYALGEVFSPTANIYVDVLAYYGTVGGFAESHDVGLYDASGNLLSSTTIDNSSTLSIPFFVGNSVTPVELFAGQTYVLVGASGVIDPYAFNDGGFAVYAPITYPGDNWIGNGGFLQIHRNRHHRRCVRWLLGTRTSAGITPPPRRNPAACCCLAQDCLASSACCAAS